MTCKDCIYYEACHDMYYEEHATRHFDPEKHNAEKECGYFKDRSHFVELPCKLGDIVYVLKGEHIEFAHVIAIYLDSSGGMFDLKIFKEIAINFYISKYNTFENIGKTVFLTLEEAEQALKLKERENNA